MFKEEYNNLEKEFDKQTKEDRAKYGLENIYLPNNPPNEPVDYILVAMEPSLDKWTDGNIETADDKIKKGFKNFAYTPEDFILHFCISQYLCRENENYHITDIAKGAMLTELAKTNRKKRYERWRDLLYKEIRLVSKAETKIIAIGTKVEEFLQINKMQNYAGSILHHSGQAARYRNEAIAGKEKEFGEFCQTIALEQVIKTADTLLDKYDMGFFKSETIERLNKSDFSESRKKLIFIYKTRFGELKHK